MPHKGNGTIVVAQDAVMTEEDQVSEKKHPSVGKWCVIRTFSAGVHCGFVNRVDGQEVELLNGRRIWEWAGAFTCSEIAMSGIDPTKSRVAIELPTIFLLDAIEIIPGTDEALATVVKCKADPAPTA